MSDDKLAAKLASVRTKSTAHMENDERASCIGTMLDDLEQLARNDGCIAAAWAIEILPVLVEQLAPAANCGGPISAERMSDISPETIEAAIERLAQTKKIQNIRSNERLRRALFPGEKEALVDLVTGDVLALVTLAEAYIKIAECPTRHAVNVLAEAAERLPGGWEIELRFSKDETSLSLVDPDTASDVDEYFGDYECSFLGAIDVAIELCVQGGDE